MSAKVLTEIPIESNCTTLQDEVANTQTGELKMNRRGSNKYWKWRAANGKEGLEQKASDLQGRMSL